MNPLNYLRYVPDAIRLARELAALYKGDHEAVRKDIADRRAEIAAKRAERDKQLAEKHGK